MIEKVSTFRKRFIEAMEIRGIKAADLSRKTGISESTISQYRSGYAEPKEKKLALIADVLSVNPTWLMGLNVSMEIIEDPSKNDLLIAYVDSRIENDRLKTYIDKINELPEDYKQLVFSSIDRIYEAYLTVRDIK